MRVELSAREQAELRPILDAVAALQEKASLILCGIVAARNISGDVKLSADGTHILTEEPRSEGEQ